eukprot:118845-Chlamydomonas_euryale.AAC.2
MPGCAAPLPPPPQTTVLRVGVPLAVLLAAGAAAAELFAKWQSGDLSKLLMVAQESKLQLDLVRAAGGRGTSAIAADGAAVGGAAGAGGRLLVLVLVGWLVAARSPDVGASVGGGAAGGDGGGAAGFARGGGGGGGGLAVVWLHIKRHTQQKVKTVWVVHIVHVVEQDAAGRGAGAYVSPDAKCHTFA